MPNSKSAAKRVRQSQKKNERNRYYGKTARNALRALLATQDRTTAVEMLPKVASMLDRLAKKNIIHTNKAANLKSQAAKHVNSLMESEAPKQAATPTEDKQAAEPDNE